MKDKLARSLLPRYKMDAIAELCKSAPCMGAIIEVGIWRGGVGLHLLDLFPARQIYLADTFTGIPYSSPKHDLHKVNDFNNVSVKDVRGLFSPFRNVHILEGIFPDKFKDTLDKETFAVVHLDVDVYKSYKDGLSFLYPRTVKGGLVFLDDYNEGGCKGATVATDEFLSKHNEEVKRYNRQYYFVKE